MAEMEKEGRPPESKRSRKPAHPVKREINEEMKNFAENTMNELLGWYGYDKVELKEGEDIEIKNYPLDLEGRQHVSVLKENSLPKLKLSEDSVIASPTNSISSYQGMTAGNGLSDSPAGSKDHGVASIIMPLIPPPILKPPTDDELINVQIVCAWCQKLGIKRYSLSMGSEVKSFCSEKCFAACRRAYFKRNKSVPLTADGCPFESSPGSHHVQQVCDWCKHIRHTKEYLDFGDGERRLQFCSAKCLNQYKMDIFYKETQANLPAGLCGTMHPAAVEKKSEHTGVQQLLTPESWNMSLSDLRRKPPSPVAPCPQSQVTVPPSSSSSSSSSTALSPSDHAGKLHTPVSKAGGTMDGPGVQVQQQQLQPPPGLGGVTGGGNPPSMVMTSRGPVPLPVFMEQQMMQQMCPPPYIRGPPPPPPHTPSPNSPLSNHLVPGLGPRSMGPNSSPSMHRSMLSPHPHHPHPGPVPVPQGLLPPSAPPNVSFPPHNLMANNGHMHLPHLMNFGVPSLAPLVPPPTLLVPYPVIVPLPVPIPIPIPIPHAFGSRGGGGSSGLVGPSGQLGSRPGEDVGKEPANSPGSTSGQQGHSKPPTIKSPSSPFNHLLLLPQPPPTSSSSLLLDASRGDIVDLTLKLNGPAFRGDFPPFFPDASDFPHNEVIDLTMSRRSRLNHAAHMPLRASVKVENENEGRSVVDLTLPSPDKRNCFDCRDSNPLEPKVLAGSGVDLHCLHTGDSDTTTTTTPPCKPLTNGTKDLDSPHCLESPSDQQQQQANNQEPQSPPTPQSPPRLPQQQQQQQALETIAANELESVKENNCSSNCALEVVEAGKKASVASPLGGVDRQDVSHNPADEDHAYALRVVRKTGCFVQPVPKATEKTAIAPCLTSTPILNTGPDDSPPPAKRRCLRIRNQNK